MRHTFLIQKSVLAFITFTVLPCKYLSIQKFNPDVLIIPNLVKGKRNKSLIVSLPSAKNSLFCIKYSKVIYFSTVLLDKIKLNVKNSEWIIGEYAISDKLLSVWHQILHSIFSMTVLWIISEYNCYII